VVKLDIVVVRVDHPEPRQVEVFVKAFLERGVGAVIMRINYFRRQPDFAPRAKGFGMCESRPYPFTEVLLTREGYECAPLHWHCL
jgi:hypothetical protein